MLAVIESFYCRHFDVGYSIYLCADPSRRCNILHKETIQEVRTYMRKALYVDHIAILDETECPVGYEVKMKKRQVEDSQPVHVGNAIRECFSTFEVLTLLL